MSFDRSASRLLVNGGPSPRPGVIETDRVTRTVPGSLRRTGKHKGPERALWAFRRAQPVRSIVTISATGEPATPRKWAASTRDRGIGQVRRRPPGAGRQPRREQTQPAPESGHACSRASFSGDGGGQDADRERLAVERAKGGAGSCLHGPECGPDRASVRRRHSLRPSWRPGRRAPVSLYRAAPAPGPGARARQALLGFPHGLAPHPAGRRRRSAPRRQPH